MTDQLPALVSSAEAEALQVTSLADLEDIVDEAVAVDRLATRGYVALAVIHHRGLFGESFEQYAYDRFGIAKSSAYRWVQVGAWVLAELAAGHETSEVPSQRAVGAGENAVEEPAGQSVPRRGTRAKAATDRGRTKREKSAGDASPVPKARELADHLAEQPPLAWVAVPTDRLRALRSVIESQLRERKEITAEAAPKTDPETDRLRGAVTRFAQAAKISYAAAVDQAVALLAAKSPSSTKPLRRDDVQPRFRTSSKPSKAR